MHDGISPVIVRSFFVPADAVPLAGVITVTVYHRNLDRLKELPAYRPRRSERKKIPRIMVSAIRQMTTLPSQRWP